jgi:hypothetical protein
MATNKDPRKFVTDKSAHIDLAIAVKAILNVLLSKQGVDGIKQALMSATNPAAVIGSMIFHSIALVKSKFDSKQSSLDPRIWQAKGGVLDQVLIELASLLISALHYAPAKSPAFWQAAKADVLDMMDGHDGQMKDTLKIHKIQGRMQNRAAQTAKSKANGPLQGIVAPQQDEQEPSGPPQQMPAAQPSGVPQ